MLVYLLHYCDNIFSFSYFLTECKVTQHSANRFHVVSANPPSHGISSTGEIVGISNIKFKNVIQKLILLPIILKIWINWWLYSNIKAEYNMICVGIENQLIRFLELICPIMDMIIRSDTLTAVYFGPYCSGITTSLQVCLFVFLVKSVLITKAGMVAPGTSKKSWKSFWHFMEKRLIVIIGVYVPWYASSLKLFLKAGKNAGMGDFKFCNYIVCPSGVHYFITNKWSVYCLVNWCLE